MCSPTTNGKKKEADTTINVQLMSDQELIRLVMVIEEREFECKIGYDLVSRPNLDAWWFAKEKDVSEWMEWHGHEDLRLAACSCLMRMLVPMKAQIAKAPIGKPLAPAEAVEQAVRRPDDVRWSYEVKRSRRTNLVIEASNGEHSITFDYQSVVDEGQKLVTVHTQMRLREKHAVISSAFSYKSSVKMHHVNPWIQTQQVLHAQAATVNGIPGEPASVAFGKAMTLVWEGMSKGLDDAHAKKSKRKDDEDGSLFAME